MKIYEISIYLLLLSGLGVLVLSLRVFNKNIKLIKNINSKENRELPNLIYLHKILIVFFLLSYLAVLSCFIFNVHIWLKMVIGILLFLGAVYVYLETYFNTKILKITNQKYIEAVELTKNLTEEQKESQESEKKYQSILENIEESYFEVDLNGNLMFFNESTCKILERSREELMGINYKAYQSKESIPLVYNAYNSLFKKKSDRGFVEYEIITKTGKTKTIDTSLSLLYDKSGNPLGFSGLARDITERKQAEKKQKQLETQIRQAQKLEAIGHLAGGIAHDFNNILTAISGNAKLLSMDHESFKKKGQKQLNNIISATERAGALINQILTFSRQNQESLYPVRLDLILNEAVKFIRSTTPATIEINTEIKAENIYTLADSTQIHQIIMNLCTNATSAMKNQNNGILDICLSIAKLNNFSGIAGNLLSGDFIELSVKDTGEGIPAEILEKIFNPFYTTRTKDQGTGLGLSTVHGIVKSYGGDIQVKSDQGKGSTFKIYFPITDKKVFNQEKTIVETNTMHGQGNILLLDDENWITESFGELFSDYGYNVYVFNSSEEALMAVKNNPDDYDVVVTDFQMPKMDGIEFAKNLKLINDDIKIILCSGNLSSIPKEKTKNLNLYAMIQKPFDDEMLTKVIQDAMGNKYNGN